MAEEATPSPAQGTEDATPQAPTDFRDYAKWRATGELPEQKDETPPAAAEEKPPAKTEPDSETAGNQEQDPESQTDDDESPTGKTKGGSRQRKIDRLTKENEELKRQMAERSAPPQDRPSQPAQPAAGEPKLEDFTSLQAYQRALTEWLLDERDRNRKQQEAQAAAEEAGRREQATWAKQVKAAQKAHDDFDEVMETEIPAPPAVKAAIYRAVIEEENGAEILYHLGKNPKELAKFAELSPIGVVKAIGKIAALLEKDPAPENGKPRITGAPKPPPPSGRPSKTSTESIEDAAQRGDFRTYARLREAQLKGR